MTDRQRDTAFLRRTILFEDTDERRKLEVRLARVQRDERCVQRAIWLMGLFALLAAAGLAYGAILHENYSYATAQFAVKVISAVGLAALVCMLAFGGVLMVYRRRMNRLLEECRALVTNLLESPGGKPQVTPPVRRSSPSPLESLQQKFMPGTSAEC